MLLPMDKLIKKIQSVFENQTLKNKILFTLAMLALYRFLVFVPVPFVDITALMSKLSMLQGPDWDIL
jgi:preprotein translocase subunit SecY